MKTTCDYEGCGKAAAVTLQLLNERGKPLSDRRQCIRHAWDLAAASRRALLLGGWTGGFLVMSADGQVAGVRDLRAAIVKGCTITEWRDTTAPAECIG